MDKECLKKKKLPAADIKSCGKNNAVLADVSGGSLELYARHIQRNASQLQISFLDTWFLSNKKSIAPYAAGQEFLNNHPESLYMYINERICHFFISGIFFGSLTSFHIMMTEYVTIFKLFVMRHRYVVEYTSMQVNISKCEKTLVT